MRLLMLRWDRDGVAASAVRAVCADSWRRCRERQVGMPTTASTPAADARESLRAFTKDGRWSSADPQTFDTVGRQAFGRSPKKGSCVRPQAEIEIHEAYVTEIRPIIFREISPPRASELLT